MHTIKQADKPALLRQAGRTFIRSLLPNDFIPNIFKKNCS